MIKRWLDYALRPSGVALEQELNPSISRRGALIMKLMDQCEEVPAGYKTPCWLWQGGNSGDGRGGGYGRVYFDGGTLATHKALWIIVNGPITGKKQLDHLCENRGCMRPSHLELVPHKENQKRRSRKGVHSALQRP